MTPSYPTDVALRRHRESQADTEAELRAAVAAGPYAGLVSRGLLKIEELVKVETAARQLKMDAASILMQQHGVPRAVLKECLTSYYGLPFVEFSKDVRISPDDIGKLNPRYLRRVGWVPLVSQEDNVVLVLIDNPLNSWKVHEIHTVFRDREIRMHVGFREDIVRYIDIASGGNAYSEKDITSIVGELKSETVSVSAGEEDDADGLVTESDSAIIQLVNQIIIDAHKSGVSDIHIEPNSNERETLVRFRVDGHCSTYQRVPGSYRKPMAARIKILAGLDISERRKPQDGKIVFRYNGQKLELRVATIPTSGNGNEDIVLRLLASGEPLPIERLNMTPRNYQQLRALLDKPYGLFLCVGPTGSGKTTTLHSALKYLNRPEKKVWTAEDPVEISQQGLRQVQVNAKIGLTFATALRAFLRADPDVVMIGEMRDSETIEIALKASLTGHLVLSTLHTNSAPETVNRLLDMGVDPFSFGDALLGVLAQRLIRTLCKNCREPYQATVEDFEQFRAAYGAEAFDRLGRPFGSGFLLYRAGGCGACGGTGYKGRTGIHELLVVSDEVRKLVHARAPVSQIGQTAMAQGMTTLCQDGLLKCLEGQTDLRQVLATTKTS